LLPKRGDRRDLVTIRVGLMSGVLLFECFEFAEVHFKRLVHRCSLRRIEAQVARESIAHRGTVRAPEHDVLVAFVAEPLFAGLGLSEYGSY
jgi:hypothetical protein